MPALTDPSLVLYDHTPNTTHHHTHPPSGNEKTMGEKQCVLPLEQGKRESPFLSYASHPPPGPDLAMPLHWTTSTREAGKNRPVRHLNLRTAWMSSIALCTSVWMLLLSGSSLLSINIFNKAPTTPLQELGLPIGRSASHRYHLHIPAIHPRSASADITRMLD